MLALEVRVNGELKAVCGAEALEHLVGWFGAKRKHATEPSEYEIWLKCQGHVHVDPSTDEALKWIAARLKLGDEVSLKFVDANQAHNPIDRQKYASGATPPDA